MSEPQAGNKGRSPVVSEPHRTVGKTATVQEVEKKAATKTPEEKATKFREIGGARTAKALKAIEVIGNLTGTNYVYTKEQATKILNLLDGEIKALSSKFEAGLNRVHGAKKETRKIEL